jgi:CubicO group peptidase (beta-lactamase class C family)
MRSTTFDFARALRGNHAEPHAPDVDGRPAKAVMELNRAVAPLRPAGGAWSSVRDLLRYVSMELAGGKLPGGKRFISSEALLERQVAQVAAGGDATYGMGLFVDTTYGVPLVHRAGDAVGFHGDVMWLPEHRVGAVVLTNGDPGDVLASVFRRKLLEVLFDGSPQADAELAAQASGSRRRGSSSPSPPTPRRRAGSPRGTRTTRSASSPCAARAARSRSTSASGGARWRAARTRTAPCPS